VKTLKVLFDVLQMMRGRVGLLPYLIIRCKM